MNVTRRNRFTQGAFKRLAALALSLALMGGFLPSIPPVSTASAAAWMRPYLDQMVEWGVMQGDANGNLNEDRQITRAEFVTLVNRAFGYTDMGPNPFTDVPDSAWYAEDVRIAHQAGYFNGSSPTTASPTALVTREQAAAMIGRSLRMQGGVGLNTSFTDNREIGAWSRGLVQEAADMGIIQGYEDGTFRPKNIITRGQVACFLVRALGTLVKEPGEQNAGGVYGNLTITTPGVKLKDTTVTGNLYLTGGVGLGNVELENVTVMGKIVVCGGGESQEGDDSVVLRNVTANGLEIDSLTDQFITVRAEGLTNIENTTVRTSAYLEDLTEDGLGLNYIELAGVEGLDAPTLHLAGNIKEVKNLTPNSSILVAQGVTNKLTMDEKAPGATLSIDNSASIRELNLDIGTQVAGTGSVGILHVNADGSVISMLPDDIQVRPGITSNIYREQMDTVAGQESSEDPRLLAGYPRMQNVASTSAEAVFSTNKKGTIRWGLSALTDGSLTEDQLLNPASYPAKVIKSGTLNANASKTELTTKLTGLTRDGSYYLSAMLVDNRTRYSPVKVTAFTTTDDSTPNFSTGYPGVPILTEDRNGDQVAQIMVMATKSCQLYYALMPKGSSTPTANAFKSGAVPGNLGFGVVDLTKDTPFLLSRLNSSFLEEQTQYDLYLWLCDADNGKSSSVRKISFTTLDKTPPVVTTLLQSNSAARTATITYTVNEPATLYWAVVPAGDTFLRPTAAGEVIKPEDLTAKIQVENAKGRADQSGNSNAARADNNTQFTISGLTAETTYDLYYVAKDRAGNYSEAVLVYTPVKTLDTNAPTASLDYFPKQNGSPQSGSDVYIDFSEVIYGQYLDRSQQLITDDFEALYKEVQAHEDDADPRMLNQAKEALATALQRYITFYKLDGEFVQANVKSVGQTDDTWDVDYREVVVSKRDGKTRLTFPNGRAINLQSGGTYRFNLLGISDGDNRWDEEVVLGPFTVVFATVDLNEGNTSRIFATEMDVGNFGTVTPDDKDDANGDFIYADFDFTMDPKSTEKVPSDINWDLLLWTDTNTTFTVYTRQTDVAGQWGAWTQAPKRVTPTLDVTLASREAGDPAPWRTMVYVSLSRYLRAETTAPALRDFVRKVEVAVHVDSIEQNVDRTSWNKDVTMGFVVLAGRNNALDRAALTSPNNNYENMRNALENGAINISNNVKADSGSEPFTLGHTFSDTLIPQIKDNFPNIFPSDTSAEIQISLDHDAKAVCYVAAPLSRTVSSGTGYVCTHDPTFAGTSTKVPIEKIPGLDQDGNALPSTGITQGDFVAVEDPNTSFVTRTDTTYDEVGDVRARTENLAANASRSITIPNLTPLTTYFLYVVIQTAKNNSETMVFQFTTLEAIRPVVEINHISNDSASITVDKSSYVEYLLIKSDAFNDPTSIFKQQMFGGAYSDEASLSGFPALGQSGTILEAMMTTCIDGHKGTIFDNHANEFAKNQVAQLIRTTSTTGAYYGHSGSFALTVPPPTTAGTNPTATSDVIYLSDHMEPNTYYTLLAVGRSSDKDAFRASQPYYLADRSLLMVTNTYAASKVSDTSPTFSGTLSIQFSGNLYGVVTQSTGSTGQGFYPLDYCGAGQNSHVAPNLEQTSGGVTYANIGRGTEFMSILGNADKVTLNGLNPGTHTPIGSLLEFTIEDVTSAQITFTTNVCGSNGIAHSKQLTVSLARSLEVDIDGNRYYAWHVNVTPEWDARD